MIKESTTSVYLLLILTGLCFVNFPSGPIFITITLEDLATHNLLAQTLRCKKKSSTGVSIRILRIHVHIRIQTFFAVWYIVPISGYVSGYFCTGCSFESSGFILKFPDSDIFVPSIHLDFKSSLIFVHRTSSGSLGSHSRYGYLCTGMLFWIFTILVLV